MSLSRAVTFPGGTKKVALIEILGEVDPNLVNANRRMTIQTSYKYWMRARWRVCCGSIDVRETVRRIRQSSTDR